MDTSKSYIKMCEKAEEIQKNYSAREMYGIFQIFKDAPKCKDFFGHACLGPKGELYIFWGIPEDNIWLPTQDQLQEMVGIREDWFYSIWNLAGFVADDSFPSGYNINDYCKQFRSMEQLWLAFVMSERYQKHWDKDKEQWTKS